MKTEKQLLEERARLVGQMEDLHTRSTGEQMSGDDAVQFDKIDAQVASLTSEIERGRKMKRSKALLAEQSELDLTAGHRAPADNAPQGEEALEYRSTFNKYLRGGMQALSGRERTQMQKRAQGTTTGAAGGFTVPENFGGELIKSMAHWGGMLDVATVTTTDGGAAMPFPLLNDTNVKGALVAENAPVPTGDMTFGQRVLNAYMYTSQIILLPLQLIQDNGVNLEGEISPIAARRLGTIINEHLTTGDGSGKPTGFTRDATTGVTSTAVDGITRNEIVSLLHSVDRAYRPNARFMLNDSTLAAIRKLSFGSGDDRPLWQPSVREGEPDRLEGFQYTVNNDMDTLGAGNNPLAFGDFSKFRVRLAGGPTAFEFGEKYMDKLQRGYMVYQRVDGRLLDLSAVKLLTNAAS